jgi:hypothetical protein
MPRLSERSLEGLRSTIRSEYAGLPAEDLERVIESSIAGLPAGTAEDFMSTLSSFGKSAAPLLQRAAPDVAQGAATGATFGPYGAIIGAGAGLVSSLIKSQEKPATAPPRPPVASAPQPPTSPPSSSAPPPLTVAPTTPVTSAPQPSPSAPAAPVPPTLPTGQGAAATLISLFQNPTVQQALLSQVLGSSGSQQVQTDSGTSLPRGAINAVLGQLLTNASEALAESESISEQSYLQDAAGEYVVDPASLDQHVALILSHLQRRAPAQEHFETADWDLEEVPAMESSEEWPEVDESVEAVSFY